MKARSSTTTATAGPERSGSAFGVPVPSITRRVWLVSDVAERALVLLESGPSVSPDRHAVERHTKVRVIDLMSMLFGLEVFRSSELLIDGPWDAWVT